MTIMYEAAPRPAHPLHAILLSYPIALFTGTLAADAAYLATAEIQWTNFASWMNAGALVVGGFALLWALIDWLVKLRRPASGRRLAYLLVVAAMWIVGLVNAFQHSRDAWSSVGMAGLAMSIVCVVLALVAGWILFSRPEAEI